MKKKSHKKKKRYKFFEHAPKLLCSAIDSLLTGKEYSDDWSVEYEDNNMTIKKGNNITWDEVLEIVKNQIIFLEEREKGWKINGVRTEENLDKYYIEEKSLYDDIKKDILTYSQVKERLHNLYNLIPINYHVNSFGLYELIEDKFGPDPEYLYNKNKSKFTIEIQKKDEHNNS